LEIELPITDGPSIDGVISNAEKALGEKMSHAGMSFCFTGKDLSG